MMESRVMISKSQINLLKKRLKERLKKEASSNIFIICWFNIEYNTKYVQFRGYILKIYISSYIT